MSFVYLVKSFLTVEITQLSRLGTYVGEVNESINTKEGNRKILKPPMSRTWSKQSKCGFIKLDKHTKVYHHIKI